MLQLCLVYLNEKHAMVMSTFFPFYLQVNPWNGKGESIFRPRIDCVLSFIF